MRLIIRTKGPACLLTLPCSKTITDVFKRHAATPLDTPVFELKEILAGSSSARHSHADFTYTLP